MRVSLILTILLGFGCSRPSVHWTAGAGMLDLFFGSRGTTIHSVEGSRAELVALRVQPDGKIVGVGSVQQPGKNPHLLAARFNPNGTLDTEFNGTGIVTMVESEYEDSFYTLALQPDGKIVAGGRVGYLIENDVVTHSAKMAVVRFNSDGSLDPTFGTAGKHFFHVRDRDSGVYDLSLLPNDQILLAGWARAPEERSALVRLNADGAVDTTFGNQGLISDLFLTERQIIFAVDKQPDGKVVAVGHGRNIGGEKLAVLARYLSNGSRDTSFRRGAGYLAIDVGAGPEEFLDVAVQPDGRIVAVGYKSKGSDNELLVMRFTSDGEGDTTFGQGGTLAVNISPQDNSGRAVLVHEDKIYIAVKYVDGIAPRCALLRMHISDGSLDTGFAEGGIARLSFSQGDLFRQIATDQAGKLVLAGTSWPGAKLGDFPFYGLSLARIWP